MRWCLRVYPAEQCRSKWQAIWHVTTSFTHLDDWSVQEGMLVWFKVTLGPILLVEALIWRRHLTRCMRKKIIGFLMELGGEWISWKRNPLSYAQKLWWGSQRLIPSDIIGGSSRDKLFLTYNLQVHWWCQQCYSIESNATAEFKDEGSHATTTYLLEKSMYYRKHWRRFQHFQTNFVNGRLIKCLQHFRLEKSETRSSETFKWVILFWYVTMLFKTYNQWQEYWKRTAKWKY